MISDKLTRAINEQIKNELYSAYLYLAMSAHFENAGLPGFGKWTRLQYQEETTHAMKFYEFLLDRGARVELMAIDKPPVDYGTPLEIFQEIFKHEQKVTGMINSLYELALQEKDYPAQVMLHWFINEQVEEEKNAMILVDQLRMAAGSTGALFNIDHHAGKRAGE